MRKFNEAIKQMRNRQKGSAGFTLVELMVVLVVMGILATMVGAGLTSYIRMARFRHNEANAKTIFQMAEIALTRKGTAGEMEAFLKDVTQNGVNGDGDSTRHFSSDETDPEEYASGANKDAEIARRNTEIYALFYDRADPTNASSKMVADLLGPYIYDESLLNASICLEVDGLTGQVYAVFYDTNSQQLRFGQDTHIEQRNYKHREEDSLVGYYSAFDQVNVITLEQSKLRVQSAQLINNETLSLVWRGNSKLQDLDTVYTVTLYDKDDGNKPLYQLEITWKDLAATLQTNNGIASLKIKKPNPTTLKFDETDPGKTYNFPLSYSQGSFTLTLDAMVDATILRAYENVPAIGETQMYSIKRLLENPTQLKAGVSVKPVEELKENYIADGKEKESNDENSHFAAMTKASGSNPAAYTLTYYRHLYNTRWLPDTTKAICTLQKKDGNDHFDWYSGNVVLYTAPTGTGTLPKAVNPSKTENPDVAWPTIPVWGKDMTLTNSDSATAKVTLTNLQLRSSSVAAKAHPDAATGSFDKYVGLIGENHGILKNLTLLDANAIVNAGTVPYNGAALSASELLFTAADGTATVLQPATTELDARPKLEAVGTVCGLSTGTLENISLTKSKNGTAQLLAVVPFTAEQKTTATDAPHGVGGIVGVAIPKPAAESAPLKLKNISTPAKMTVAGLLQETDGALPAAAETEAEEKARYNHAALEPTEANALWRAIGVGGLAGVYDATGAADSTTDPTKLTNAATVTGNGFTGGVVGNLYNTGATKAALNMLINTGDVAAGNNYKPGSALGQFFGGIAGYAKNVALDTCTSSMAADQTQTTVTPKIKSGFAADGSIKDSSPLKGDFVGGLLGFGNGVTLNNYSTEKGYVMGRTFVGGFVGGFSDSTLSGTATNAFNVFGQRYVGGAIAVNGAGSTIQNVTNKGLISAMGKNAAYVGGIAAVNDATWGKQGTTPASATILNCTNLSGSDLYTNNNNAAFLLEISKVDGGGVYTSDFVGGITGYNGKGGAIDFGTAAAPQVNAVLYGGNYVGGVAGYHAPDAGAITGTSITVNGTVQARGNAVGGFIGMNRKAHVTGSDTAFPDNLNIAVSSIRGCYCVGGVIGANLPQGAFTVSGAAGSTWNTTAAAGSLNANGVAGGIIGYNQVQAVVPDTALAGDTQAVKLSKLLPTIGNAGTTGTVPGVLYEPDSAFANPTATTQLGFVTNKLNINANLYVGGIVGYNATTTALTLNNAVNGVDGNLGVGGINKNADPLHIVVSGVDVTPTEVSFNAELAALGTRYDASKLDTDVTTGFAGGLIGINNGLSTLDGCVNYGNIQNHSKVLGGMAALNLGKIQSCQQSANLGNKQTGYLYIGGIAGINIAATADGATSGGTIQNSAVASGRTVAGESYVGGIAGANRTPRLGDANLGAGITVPSLTGYTVIAMEYAGGIAGVNYGTVGPEATAGSANLEATVTADNQCAGGAVGSNAKAGYVYALVHSAGNIQAANRAGGIAGENAGTIKNCVNGIADNATGGTVTATAQYAGGIAGYNNGLIENGKHLVKSANQNSAPVTAATGYAGGIAGYNDTDGAIKNGVVSGGVRAASGEAGGITAHNKGTVDGGAVTAADNTTRISGTARAIGAVAAYNEGTVQSVTLSTQSDAAKRPHLVGPATQVGALVGDNTGTVKSCNVSDNSIDFSALTAGSITLGGAVGVNEGGATVDTVGVTLDITENTGKYIDIGGVVGGNHGTVNQCTYAGKLGDAGATATRLRATVGGLAGYNSGTVQNSGVGSIELNAQGAFSVDASQSANDKLESASHVGGAVGRNDGTISGVTVATTDNNIVSAQYGFVGGVAGSNNGNISNCGGDGTQTLVANVATWLKHDDKTTAQKNALIKQMVAALKNTVVKDASNGTFTVTAPTIYAGLLGNDTVNNPSTTNKLLVTLAGGDTAASRGNGYLGGLAGFNATHGQITDSATGQWFVYGNNIEVAAAMGGAIGQNEAEQELKHLVNCAAVRRFCRTVDDDTGKDDNWNGNNQGGVVDHEINDHVGGLIGAQQNRTASGWKITDCVNWGSVFNSRSNNVGGIVSNMSNNGGDITRCYNYGYLACNTTFNQLGAGTIGGIVGYFDMPTSGDTVNILSCRNYGGIYGVNESGTIRRANDCAGIFGKTMLTNPTDPLTINIFDCVNEAPIIQANSVVAGIIAWLGPTANIENVPLNIDRCRNFCINLECVNGNAIAGISGNRGAPWGYSAYTSAATTVTNCFALYNVPITNLWVNPIYYNPNKNHVVASNNYYMRPCSFDAAYNAGFQNLDRNYGTNAEKGTTSVDNTLNFGRLLYAGQDKGASASDASNQYSYFGADLIYKNDEANINSTNYKIEANATGGFSDPTVMRTIYCGPPHNTNAAYLPLLFNEVDGNGVPSWGDVTDDVIQNYYEYLLDSTLPAAATNVQVARSEDTANVYGKYLVTWDPPKTGTVVDTNVTDYKVEILIEMDPVGNPGVFTVEDTKSVYNCETSIEGKAEWTGKQFKVRVTTHNTKGDGPAAESAVANFVQNMPKPDLEVRLVKTDAGYKQWLVLKNTADYADKLGADKYDWTVAVDLYNGGTKEKTVTIAPSATADKTNLGEYYLNLDDTAGRRNYRAYAEPKTGTTLANEWMRSEQFNENLYVPNVATAKGLAEGTLTFDAANITVTGTTVNDLSIASTLKFTPTNAGLAPRYTVALVGKAKAGSPAVDVDDVTGIDISGQYVVLASASNAVQPTGTTFTLNNLPSDVLTDFEDWQIVAYPTNSGEGPVTTVYKATGTEVATAIAAASDPSATETDIRKAATLELTRAAGTAPGTFTYTAQHATPLGYLGAGAPSQLKEIALSDKVTVLTAPTLQAFLTTSDPYSINAKNELEYTFTWTQTLQPSESLPAVGEYLVALYGVAADGTETEIPFVSGYDPAAHIVSATATDPYTYTLNIDTDLQNGSESWRFGEVRLQVTRKADPVAPKQEIGAADSKKYTVKTRLAKVSAPGAVSPTVDAQSSAVALNYTITWPAITDTTNLAGYTLYAEKYDSVTNTWSPARKADGTTPLSWTTTDTNPTLTVNLEANQGQNLRFYAVANSNNPDVLQGPNGTPDAGSLIMTRQAAPTLTGLGFGWDGKADADTNPMLENFLNNLTLKFTTTPDGNSNYYFTGYLFKEEGQYNDAVAAVNAWQDTSLTPAQKADKYQDLCTLLAGQVTNGDATLMVAPSSVNVGQSATAGTDVSYTLTPANGFAMQPEYAGRYLLPAVHTMPKSGPAAPSAWSFYVPGTEPTLPAIKLDAPNVAPASADYTATAVLYEDDTKANVISSDYELTTSHTTIQWQPVNNYTKGDTTTNLTSQYEVKVTPNTTDFATLTEYLVRITVAARDIPDAGDPAVVQYHRGDILKVEKSMDDGVTYFPLPAADGEDYYDLSQTEVGDGTLQSNPVAVTGHVEAIIEGNVYPSYYFELPCIPKLTTSVAEDGTHTYGIVLPDLSVPVTASDSLQHFTASVSVVACDDADNATHKAGYTVTNSEPAVWPEAARVSLMMLAQGPMNLTLEMPATPETAAASEPTETENAAPEATDVPAPTPTATPLPTATPTPTATATPAPTATAAPVPTATVEPAPTPTVEPTPTATAEPTPTESAAPEPTETPEPGPEPEPEPEPTPAA